MQDELDCVFMTQVLHALAQKWWRRGKDNNIIAISCLLTGATAVANFLNEACATGGVEPSDPLLFTCEVNGVVLLRVVLPTGDQEIISLGDTVIDVDLPPGFTAESLDITVIDGSTRNFNLTLSIDSASLLGGGEIMCDDTTPSNKANATCPITGKLSSPSHFSLLCWIIM